MPKGMVHLLEFYERGSLWVKLLSTTHFLQRKNTFSPTPRPLEKFLVYHTGIRVRLSCPQGSNMSKTRSSAF